MSASRTQFVSETLCRTMSRNMPLPPVGSCSSVRRSVPRMQMTRRGRRIDAIVRSERVFLRRRFLKTNGKNFIRPPASGRPRWSGSRSGGRGRGRRERRSPTARRKRGRGFPGRDGTSPRGPTSATRGRALQRRLGGHEDEDPENAADERDEDALAEDERQDRRFLEAERAEHGDLRDPFACRHRHRVPRDQEDDEDDDGADGGHEELDVPEHRHHAVPERLLGLRLRRVRGVLEQGVDHAVRGAPRRRRPSP